MACSKSLGDIGAANLKDLKYKKCGILYMERQGSVLKVVCGRFCPRFVVVSKGSKTNRTSPWCLFCYKDQFSRRADAVYILKECSGVEEYTDSRDRDINGFTVIFSDTNRKNLVFACPSEESKQIWITAISSGITESHNYSADSGFASEGSVRDLLIDPVANDYVPESKIRQSRIGYDDIDDADLLVEVTVSQLKKERKEKPLKKTSVSGDINTGTDPCYIYMNQSPEKNEVNVASSGIGEEGSQAAFGSSMSFLDVSPGLPSAESISCVSTQETRQPGDCENTCPKTIEESSDESSVESTSPYENLKFHEDEYLQRSREENISRQWITEQPIGTFIVRPGTKSEKELCVNAEQGVKIYHISEKPGKVYLLVSEDIKFHTLDDLVNFYQLHDLPSRHTHQRLSRGYKSEK